MTICTWGKWSIFGHVEDGQMILSEFGQVIQEEWSRTSVIRQEIKLDVFQIMPNHFHGMLAINRDPEQPLETRTETPILPKSSFS